MFQGLFLKSTVLAKAALLLFGLLLVACSYRSPLPTKANKTETLQEIEALLERAEADRQQAQQAARAAAPVPAQPQTERRSVPRFDVSVRDLPAQDFFLGLASGSTQNLVVHPEVAGSITLDLRQVTLDEVLTTVAMLYDYDIDRQGAIYTVFPGGVTTRVFAVNHLNIKRQGSSDIMVSSGQLSTGSDSFSGDEGGGFGGSNGLEGGSSVLSRISTVTDTSFWDGLQEALSRLIQDSKDGVVITDRAAGLVIVRARRSDLRVVEDYLRRSQLFLQRQVVLEARVLEVTLGQGYEQGINWSYLDTFSTGIDASGDALKSLTLGQASQPIVNNELGGVFSASLRINDFSTFIQLLGTQGSVQVLSSPRIATTNNQKAVIKVGTDEFFVTGIETSEDTSNDNSNLISDVELTPFFSGIALDVTPQISADDEITLHVHPTVSEVKDQVKTVTLSGKDLVLPLAFSTVRETDSVIRARDGQLVVIGGLIQNVTVADTAEVPVLADIPWMGEMFRQRRNETRKVELVILIRPTLVDRRDGGIDLPALEERFLEFEEPLADG